MIKSINNIAIRLLLAIILFPIQTIGQNFVKTKRYLDANGTNKIISVEYFDGLGRRALSASNGIGINGKYVYQMEEYDTRGRSSRQWLPAVGNTTLSYLQSDEYRSLSVSNYNDTIPYTDFHYNTLNQPTTTNNPGATWRINNKMVTYSYGTNAANSVKKYTALLNGNSLVKSGCYAKNTLTKEETEDEDGKTVQVYKDALDRIILERRLSGVDTLDTYYVYNELNQLCYVLTPHYQFSGFKEKYAYEYRYNDHGKLEKKIRPHCETEHNYYDVDGRVIYRQDPMGRFWFFFYDSMGRLVIKGTCNNFNYHRYEDVSMHAGMEGLFGSGYVFSSPSTLSHGSPEEIFFYDSYQFLANNVFSSSPYHALLTRTENRGKASGMQTGSIRRTSSGQYLLSAIYYDEKGRVIDQRETLEGGGIKTTVTTYSFTNKPLIETYTLNKNGTTTITKTYTYHTSNDQQDSVSIAYNGGTSVTITEYEQNDLGQLETLHRGGNAGDVSYEYNLRGWPVYIGGKGFEEWLHYTDGLGTPCYSGNISSQLWHVDMENFKRGYRFYYDGFGRMGLARYAEGNNQDSNVDRYTEWVKKYMSNGGVRKIERYGKKSNGKYGKIDNLWINYDGMQISNVEEDALPLTYSGAFDFVSKTINQDGTQYRYYGNGDLKWDANKGVTLIDYDLNDHPLRLQFHNGNVTKYVYSSSGKKLKTVYYTAVPNIHLGLGQTLEMNSTNTLNKDSIQYFGDFIFENGQLSKFLYDGGYMTFSNSQPIYHYFTQDHLGSNRAVVNHDGIIEQIRHYYPFGAVYSPEGTNDGLQKYKYNGKELDRMFGLNQYDYGARNYDPLLCRFTQIDPLCEKYYNFNPYAYCGNNPVKFVDPDGRDPGDFFISLDLAAMDFGKYTNPLSIQNNREYATSFYTMRNEKGETGYSYTHPRMGGPAGVSSYTYISRNKKGKVTDSKVTTKEKAVATGHTHGAYDERVGIGNDVFSGIIELRGIDDGEARKAINDKGKDIGSSNAASLPDYLVTPNGTLQHYDPSTGEIRIIDTDMPKDIKDTNKLEDIKNFYGQK